ncbi:hypothetical protein [Streptomyces microflavus]|uniref:hypothetical protein n=1 Tax=Streptomyces microflavus TaxID=1919 RepID=UPI002E313245|nr:hypothetical protein [Streptomyces microflavus]
MNTCPKFARIRAKYEQETTYLLNHAARSATNGSAGLAKSSKRRMARDLSGHVARCLECG